MGRVNLGSRKARSKGRTKKRNPVEGRQGRWGDADEKHQEDSCRKSLHGRNSRGRREEMMRGRWA